MNAERLLQHFDRISEAPEAIPHLRQFILDLAVRGKLVEQDPSDEPASELLKRIQAEKERLFEANKIEKQEQFSSISDEERFFEVPSGWSWARLITISRRIHYGFTASANQFLNDIRLLRITDIQNNSVDWSAVPGCEISAREIEQYKLEEGDILIARTGGTIGKTFLVKQIPVVAVFASYLIRVQGSTELNDQYLKLFLESPVYWKQLQDGVKGGGQPNVNGQTLGRMIVSIPPLAEQHRIVAKVDELMALCDQLEAAKTEREQSRDRLIAASLHHLNSSTGTAEDDTLEAFRDRARFYFNHLPRLTTRLEHIKQLRQTILNLAVRGKLVPQDPNDEPAAELLKQIEEWREEAIRHKQIREPRKALKGIDSDEVPYPLPRGWAWARLGKVIHIQSGDGLTAAKMKSGNIPVFGGNGINGYHDEYNVEQPTIVIGRVGYYCGSIHVTPDKAWVTDNAFVTRFCQEAIWMKFLVLLLSGTDLKENEKATAQPVISGSKIYPIIVGLPPLAEQHRIVAKVDELMALCNQLETQLITTEADSRRFLEAILDQALGTTSYRASEQKFGPTKRGSGRQKHLDNTLSQEPRLPDQNLHFMNTNPVKTIAQMVECLTVLGGTATPERLLNATVLGDDVDKFFDLLREGRDSGLLSVPTGSNQIVRRIDHAN